MEQWWALGSGAMVDMGRESEGRCGESSGMVAILSGDSGLAAIL